VQADNLRHEISILSEVSNPGIARMHEWLESDLAIWLVIDHVPGGTLRQHVASHGSLSGYRTKTLLTQLLSGIAYLFLNRIAPLRICDETLRLDANSDLIISDLSCAFEYCKENEVHIDALITGRYGSDIYVAPEAYGSNPYNARKAVMWSCGVVLVFNRTPCDFVADRW
jgi:serine/threonine protein kinase